MPSPLDLPEIRTYISRFLCPGDLAQCALVSKDWRSSFECHIYHNIILRSTPRSDKVLPRLTLERHLCDLKKLDLNLSDKNLFITLEDLAFPYLRHLVLYMNRPAALYMLRPAYRSDFILRHRLNLTRLELYLLHDPKARDNPVELWETAASLPALTDLTVSRINITPNVWPSFHCLWSRLTRLHITGLYFVTTIDDNDNTNSNSTSPSLSSPRDIFQGLGSSRIKEMSWTNLIGVVKPDSILLFLEACPDLETFRWNHFPHTFPKVKMGERLAYYTRHCPQLTKLTLSMGVYNEENVLLPFLKARMEGPFRPLKELSANGMLLGNVSMQQIVANYDWSMALRVLDLESSTTVLSQMGHTLLCSVPGLQDFSVGLLRETDFVKDARPWVCLGLTRLCVGIELDPSTWIVPSTSSVSSFSFSQGLFQRIGKLTSLKSLEFPHSVCLNVLSSERYQLRLDYGLMFMTGLRQLRLFKVRRYFMSQDGLRLTRADAQLMIQTWPQLRCLIGVLHSDPTENKFLRGWFHDRGVESKDGPDTLEVRLG